MEIARIWRQQPSNLRLMGSRCMSCESVVFPERICCPECSSADLKPFQLKGRGALITWTKVYEAPQGFADQVPYTAGLVQLDEGPRIAAMITDVDCEQLETGMRLEMVTRRIRSDGDDTPIVYGYKFRPVQCDEPE